MAYQNVNPLLHAGRARMSTPACGDTSKALASSCLLQGGDQGNLAPGSPSTGSQAGRTPVWRQLNVQSGPT